MPSDTKQPAVGIAMAAIRWLADRCDWAHSQDGKGFNGTDAPLGHALAGKEVWSRRETLAALRLIVKYTKQLSSSDLRLEGLDALRDELQREVGDVRLRKRDVVAGDVWVDMDARQIVLKTDYNAQLVEEIRELLGRSWVADKQQWTCGLCAENGVAVEEMATRWGLVLRKHPGWKDLVSARRVEVARGRLVVHGVSAGPIIHSIPKLTGVPAVDEVEFGAIEYAGSDRLSIAIPLQSWIIRDALLWLENLDDRNARRLEWARGDISKIFEEQYPLSLLAERQRFDRAAATTLPDDAQATLCAALPVRVAERLMPHQWVGVQALTEHSQCVLADQQGLGKTVEVLAALEVARAFPAVVIAPAAALLNWRDEAADWLPHRKVAVLGGIGKRDQGVPPGDADLVIINYESFSKHIETLAAVHPKALVADEAQFLKGYGSARTKAVKQFCRDTGVGRIIAATGTPVMNRPSELLTLLTLVPDMLAELGGFGRFAARYCSATRHSSAFTNYWDYSGAANLGELANRLRETGRFIRRDKASVLLELAPKTHFDVPVDIVNRVEYQVAVEDFALWLKTHNRPKKSAARSTAPNADDSDDTDASQLREAALALGWAAEDVETLRLDGDDRAEALRRTGALRQLCGIGKIPAAVEWIKERVKDEKLVVFAYHIEVQERLAEALASHATLSITAGMSLTARREAILRFQCDPAARLIVCSLKAAQTAITLTAARCVLMVELDWTPSALEQAEDRVHRIGQTGQVEISYLHAAGTLDDRMATLVRRKRETINTLTAATAPFGYRKDGAPRKQLPGPGRPRLDPATRVARRKTSKAVWQASNLDYMRDYMRERRLKARIKSAKRALRELASTEQLGYDGMLREMGGRRRDYTPSDHERRLADERAAAQRARELLEQLQVSMP